MMTKTMKLYLDAGTTWAKIIAINPENDFLNDFSEYLISQNNDKYYFIAPSKIVKTSGLTFEKSTGHMASNLIKDPKDHQNEILALAQGAKEILKGDSIILDLGSRDSKWVKYKDSKFKDLDWNSSCARATGATIEMLIKFYDLNLDEITPSKEKYSVTCGIFGLEKIMDDIANGESANTAIAKFIHGIAFNAWTFSQKPDSLYLSGGFCENKCFVASLSNYTKVTPLGRFVLTEGLL